MYKNDKYCLNSSGAWIGIDKKNIVKNVMNKTKIKSVNKIKTITNILKRKLEKDIKYTTKKIKMK